MIEVGIGVAIIMIASAIAKAILRGSPNPWNKGISINLGNSAPLRVQPVQAQAQSPQQAKMPTLNKAERAKALEAYKQLVHEKMDVIKTALAMGYRAEELERLDERLEKLIGREQIANIMAGIPPRPNAELLDRDLNSERERLAGARNRSAT
jgi:hypothetical protein